MSDVHVRAGFGDVTILFTGRGSLHALSEFMGEHVVSEKRFQWRSRPMGYEQGMVNSLKLRISPKAERTWEAVAHHLRWSLPTLLRLGVERLIGRE